MRLIKKNIYIVVVLVKIESLCSGSPFLWRKKRMDISTMNARTPE
ncbi:MAG: hypothetical protein ACPGSD_16140 [Flavobacteriales bacterium]